MHVVQVIDSLYRGGAQQLLVTFAIEAQRRGIKTSVVCLKDEDRGSNLVERLNSLGVEVVRFAAPKMLAPKRIWQLTRWLRRNRVSVVHTHLTYGNVVGILAARLANIPVVATMHLAGFDPSIANRQQQFEAQIVRFLAQQIIAVGYTTNDAYQPIMPNRTLHVVHNAVVAVPEISVEQRNTTREAILGDPDLTMLINVGRFAAIKDLPTLIDAFALVHPEHPQARLVLAGEGDQRPKIEAKIDEHQLHAVVNLLGARDDIPVLLRSADVFVSSSANEGLPIAVLEAMAAGLPIVATKVGDIPQVVREQAGVTVAPHDHQALAAAINQLLSEPSHMQQMQQAAQTIIEQYHSPSAWVDQLLALYTAAHEGVDQREAVSA